MNGLITSMPYPPLGSMAPDPVLIRLGDKGTTVKIIQLYLLRAGYGLGQYGADGDFGPTTEKAVIAFNAAATSRSQNTIDATSWRALLTAPVKDSSVKVPKVELKTSKDGSRVELAPARQIPLWVWLAGGTAVAAVAGGLILRRK